MSETGPGDNAKSFFGRLKNVIDKLPKDSNADIFQRQRLVDPPPNDHFISERTKPLDTVTVGQREVTRETVTTPINEDKVLEIKHIGENGSITKIK